MDSNTTHKDTANGTPITNMNSLVAETPWHIFASNCTLDNSDWRINRPCRQHKLYSVQCCGDWQTFGYNSCAQHWHPKWQTWFGK